MMPRRVFKAWQAFLIVGLCTGQALNAVPTGVTGSTELEVPRPDLSALKPAAREKIEQTRDHLVGLVQRPGFDQPAAADGFGFLGQLYQAYELRAAAEECYMEASGLAPDDYQWPHLLGLVRNEQGDFEGAIEAYRDSLALNVGELSTLLRLGNALLELGRDDEALRCFEDALSLEPDNATALFGAGRVAQNRGEHQKAVSLFERVLEVQPDANIVHYPLGVSYRQMGQTQKAREHMARQGKRGVRIEDPLADMLTLIEKQTAFQVVADLAQEKDFSEEDFLGFILSHFAKAEGSANRLRDTVQQVEDSDSPPGAVALGRLHYAVGALLVAENRDEEALSEFRRAVELAPGLKDARVKLGNGLARAGRLEEALAQYDVLVAADPNNAEIGLKRATVLLGLDRADEARVAIEGILERDSSNRLAHLKLANCLERQGDLDGAMNQFKAALESSETPPEKAEVHLRVAQMFRRLGERRAAVIAYDRSLQADPAHVDSLLGLASVLGEMGNYEQSAEVFARVIEQDPDSAEAWVGEATAWIMGGDHDKARDRMEVGLKAQPDNLDLADILARHLAACPDQGVRDGERALELARRLYDDLPTAESMETLAMAYAQAGRFEDAVAWQRKLIREYGDNAMEGIAERWQANLARYERAETCCAQL